MFSESVFMIGQFRLKGGNNFRKLGWIILSIDHNFQIETIITQAIILDSLW